MNVISYNQERLQDLWIVDCMLKNQESVGNSQEEIKVTEIIMKDL